MAENQNNPLPACAGRRVIITGAADGTGALCARVLAECGADLLLVDFDKVMVNRLAAELGAEAFSLDVLSELGVGRFMTEIKLRNTPVDLLINAAGSGHVRTLGMFRVTAAFARIVGDRPATVINVGSTDMRGDPFRHSGAQLPFGRASADSVSLSEKPELSVMTVEAPKAREQVVELLRNWCGCSGERGVNLSCGPPEQAGTT